MRTIAAKGRATAAQRAAEARAMDAYNSAMNRVADLEERARTARTAALALGGWLWFVVLLSPSLLPAVAPRERWVDVMLIECAAAGAGCLLLAAACIALHLRIRGGEKRALTLRP